MFMIIYYWFLSTDQHLISNMYNNHIQSGHLSTNLQAKKYIYPVFWLESQYYLQINAWFQICTMIINSQDTYQQIYKRKNIYTPVFDLSHSTINKSTPDFKYYNDLKQSGHLSTNLQAKKYIYSRFWLESQYYLQINAWFQICTMIIYSQDTYQQIYKQKNIYTPVFDLSHSLIYKSTPNFNCVQ